MKKLIVCGLACLGLLMGCSGSPRHVEPSPSVQVEPMVEVKSVDQEPARRAPRWIS